MYNCCYRQLDSTQKKKDVCRRGGKSERFLTLALDGSDQLHAPRTFIPAESTPVRIGQQAWWATQTARLLLKKKKPLQDIEFRFLAHVEAIK